MDRPLLLLPLLVAFVASATSAQGQTCSSPPPGEVDYFPLGIGTGWEYSYESYEASIYREWGWGRLTLTVLGANCTPSGGTYTVEEHRRGFRRHFVDGEYDTTAVNVVRIFNVVEVEGEVSMPAPYMSETSRVARYEPETAPEEVIYSNGYRAPCGAGWTSTMRLRRNVGMVYHRYHGYNSGSECRQTLTFLRVVVAGEESPVPPSLLRVEAYPSVASTTTTVRVSGPATGDPRVRLALLDMTGRVVREWGGARVGEEQSISLEGLASGVYFVRASTLAGITSSRLIVTR